MKNIYLHIDLQYSEPISILLQNMPDPSLMKSE